MGYIDDLLFDRDLRFMEEFYPGVTPILRTSTVIAQMNAVVAGAGIGVIPYFMAHAEKELVPVLPDQSIESGYWLQFNPDSRQIARVRTTIDFIVKQIESDKDLFLALPNDKEITGLKFYSCCNDVVIKRLITMLLGCIMDSMAIVLLTIPVFYTLIQPLNFEPIWFGFWYPG